MHQGRRRGAQRDLDGHDDPDPRGARALDAAGHPALLLADTISSLGTLDFRMDEWGVDAGSAAARRG